jgi:hypothetical protein
MPVRMPVGTTECQRGFAASFLSPLCDNCGIPLRNNEGSLQIVDVVALAVVLNVRVIDVVKAAKVVVWAKNPELNALSPFICPHLWFHPRHLASAGEKDLHLCIHRIVSVNEVEISTAVGIPLCNVCHGAAGRFSVH